MKSFKDVVAALTRLPAGSQFGLAAGLLLVVAALAVGWLWSAAPEYRVLFSNVADRDGGAIVAALDQLNVPHKYNEGGTAILVPAHQVHDARLKLASQGLPKGSLVGFELMETQKFGLTQFQEQVNFQRGLEGELARSIQSLAAVASARVHLALPKASVFLREQDKPSASVLVTLHPGRALERAQVNGIVHLVSSSVPKLAPGAVSVLDQQGNLLSGTPTTLNLDPAQLAYVQQLEASVVKRIQDILEPIVGRSNVRTQVNADIDFSQAETTAESFKPNQGAGEATVRTQQSSEAGGPAGQIAQGVPGAASNAPGVTPAANASATSSAAGRKDNTVTYEVDRAIRHIRQPTGAIRRLSVAVVVNHRKVGNAAPAPLPDEALKQINDLVKEAMGYNEARRDTLNIANAAFTVEAPVLIPELPLWQQPDNIALAKEVGKTAALGLLFLYLLFGIIRPLFKRIGAAADEIRAERNLPPVQLAADGSFELPPEPISIDLHNQRLESVRALARQDPKIVANIVRNWVSNE